MSVRFTSLASSLVILAAACGTGSPPAEPDRVQAELRDKLPPLLDSAGEGVAFAGESTALAAAGEGVTAASDSVAGAPEEETTEPVPAPEEETTFELPSGDEVADALIESIFNEDNYEGDGTYLIPPEAICPEDETGAIEPECAQNVADAELRVRVELVAGGLDFTLLVGPDRAAPVALELREDRLAVVGDLAQAASAAEHIAGITGEAIELPEVLRGVVALSLIRHGAQDVAIELAVREKVEVVGQLDGGDRIEFSTAAREPLAALRLDGAAKRITAGLDLGPTILNLPWQSVFSESFATGELRVDWKGLSAEVTAEDGADTLEIANLGFGDGTSTVSLDELALFSLDLNPEDGRRLALSIAPSAGGYPTFSMSPKLDLTLDFNLAPLAQAGDEIAAHLLDETYGVLFDGASPAAQPREDGLKIVSGALTLSSSGAASDVVVSEGQCLISGEPSDPDAHPILGALAAADCP